MSGGQRSSVWTIVVAAGAGTRFGAPKQFLDLVGTRVVDRSIATAARHSDGVVVVTPAEPGPGIMPIEPPNGVVFREVVGAESRASSVRHGLAAVPDDVDIVLVHDAARPLATDAIYIRVIDAVTAGADAVTPAVPIVDTLRRRGGGTVDRSEVVAVQTPQGFAASALRAAHATGGDPTDDVTVVEDNGGTVVVVDGDRRNIKLTTPLDLDIAALFVERDRLEHDHLERDA
ncbi:MAG: IspD/TarI family cytidylyltransferase [Acidimicrobiales bacterium]|jgi:2-C-methyl-D-erythritol 4-phosphate cytidylyltransferase|nr:IspD/TarI family cytidylyltransferase [Acidimicrobiales bacterium]